jgi:hypothetical protein
MLSFIMYCAAVIGIVLGATEILIVVAQRHRLHDTVGWFAPLRSDADLWPVGSNWGTPTSKCAGAHQANGAPNIGARHSALLAARLKRPDPDRDFEPGNCYRQRVKKRRKPKRPKSGGDCEIDTA